MINSILCSNKFNILNLLKNTQTISKISLKYLILKHCNIVSTNYLDTLTAHLNLVPQLRIKFVGETIEGIYSNWTMNKRCKKQRLKYSFNATYSGNVVWSMWTHLSGEAWHQFCRPACLRKGANARLQLLGSIPQK